VSSYREFLILRYKAIFRNVGNITIGLSLLILAISFFAFINDGNKLFFSFFIPAILTFLTGLFFRIISRGERKKELSIHDATVTVFLVWSLAIFLSSLPFIFANYLNFTQAIFESTSGWTGTGLSMFLDVEILPKSILLWRSVTQYVGGAGFAIITVIIAGSVGAGIYQAEGRSDNLVPNLRESAKIILRIYIIWAIIGTILLMTIGKLPFFDSFNHTLTALATGGFSTKNLSIGAYNSLSVEIIIMILMIMGATGFGIHYAAILMVKNFFRYRKELKKGVLTKLEFKEKIRSEPFLKNPEPRLMFVILLIFSTLLFLFSLLQMYGIKEGIINSIFQSISSLTGTGFSTVSFINWNSFGLLILTLLMIFGGMMDSTSSGLKLYRIYIAFELVLNQIKSFFKPSGTTFYLEVYKGISRKKIDVDAIKNVIVVFTAYFVTYFVGVFVLLGYGYSLPNVLFELASTVSNVGLSVGITGPQAPLGVLWTEIIVMYLGRLEFFVIINSCIKIIRDLREVTTF